MSNQHVQEFVKLSREKRQLESRLEEVKAALRDLQDPISDHFEREALQNCSIDGGTVYRHRQVFASLIPDSQGCYDQAHQALRQAGMAHIIQTTVNHQDLITWVRDLEEREAPLPREVQTHIKVSEVFQMRERG